MLFVMAQMIECPANEEVHRVQTVQKVFHSLITIILQYTIVSHFSWTQWLLVLLPYMASFPYKSVYNKSCVIEYWSSSHKINAFLIIGNVNYAWKLTGGVALGVMTNFIDLALSDWSVDWLLKGRCEVVRVDDLCEDDIYMIVDTNFRYILMSEETSLWNWSVNKCSKGEILMKQFCQ